jgi:hypothetical protein
LRPSARSATLQKFPNSYRMPHARGTTTLDFIAMLLQAAGESNLFGRCSKQNPSAGGVRPFGHNSGLHHVRQAGGAEVLWRQGKQGPFNLTASPLTEIVVVSVPPTLVVTWMIASTCWPHRAIAISRSFELM